jgi:hypothetical protein
LPAISGVSVLIIWSQKEKEDLDDISNELELADEDDKIPFVVSLAPHETLTDIH